MKKLSIVSPVHNEELCIGSFVTAIRSLALERDYEIIFVDDGSSDGTLAEIKRQASEDSRIRYISFSRNFGKEAALLAGFRGATGELVVAMDVDGQHDPKLLPEMLKAVEEEGYDSAAACRTDRAGEPLVRTWFAHRFYALMNRVAEIPFKDGAMDYRLMTRRVVESVLKLGERARFARGLYTWVGFKTKWIESPNLPRLAGKSQWSFISLFLYSMKAVISFSAAPLHVAFVLSVISLALSIFFFAVGMATAGIIALFQAGQFLVVGIVGVYVAETFRETKDRPLYIIREEG